MDELRTFFSYVVAVTLVLLSILDYGSTSCCYLIVDAESF